MIVITNGQIVTENGILTDFDVLVKEQVIAGVVPSGLTPYENNTVIDAEQGYIMPGFIDIHADYIEHMAAPRPTSMMDFELSLRESEKQLLGQGITTMFHSLSLYKQDLFDQKPVRTPENVKRFAELIHKTHTRKHLIRHRFHARYELDNTDELNSLKTMIAEGKVHLVSFMDHTPGQGQYRNLEVYKKTLKGYRALSDDAVDQVIFDSHVKEMVTIEDIREIAGLAKENNIAVASHDDDTLEKVALVKGYGTTISEFPITMEVALEAKKHGMLTMAGAPNVLLGGSHSGNLCATKAIEHGAIDILCSDYYPPAMLHAVFKLHDQLAKPLHEMVKLVTINPAKAVGMDHLLGSIAEEKKADLIIVQRIEDNFPVITTVMVDGRIVSETHYRI